jgi:hypothetical protein
MSNTKKGGGFLSLLLLQKKMVTVVLLMSGVGGSRGVVDRGDVLAEKVLQCSGVAIRVEHGAVWRVLEIARRVDTLALLRTRGAVLDSTRRSGKRSVAAVEEKEEEELCPIVQLRGSSDREQLLHANRTQVLSTI